MAASRIYSRLVGGIFVWIVVWIDVGISGGRVGRNTYWLDDGLNDGRFVAPFYFSGIICSLSTSFSLP